jgi:hypothetical protein
MHARSLGRDVTKHGSRVLPKSNSTISLPALVSRDMFHVTTSGRVVAYWRWSNYDGIYGLVASQDNAAKDNQRTNSDRTVQNISVQLLPSLSCMYSLYQTLVDSMMSHYNRERLTMLRWFTCAICSCFGRLSSPTETCPTRLASIYRFGSCHMGVHNFHCRIERV